MDSDKYKNINSLNESDPDISIQNQSNLLFDPEPHEDLSNLNQNNHLSSSTTISSTTILDPETKNLLNETDSLKEELNEPNFQRTINWKDEIYKGNFMPAFVLLDKKKINVDEIIDTNTENRLLHLALSFSYTNVTRGLLEIFKCNINIKNRFGHTPFHILCNNENDNVTLFSYLVKNEELQYDERDRTGVTPLFFTIISKQNIPFLILLYKKSNIYNIDDMGNNSLYFTLSSDNKFALNFILRSSPRLSLNARFFSNKACLSEVLISCKDRRITKHLIKYFHHQLELESIIGSQKSKLQFNFYNNFNYDLLNTLYFYKTKNYFGFINKVFSKDVLSNYIYVYYNLKFLIYDLILPNMNENFKYFLIGIYCFFISFYFFEFIKSSNFMIANKDSSFFSNFLFFLIYQTSSIVCLFISLFYFYINKTPKIKTCYNSNVQLTIASQNNPYYADDNQTISNSEGNPVSLEERRENNHEKVKEPYYDYEGCQHNSDNILNILYQAVERNPMDIVFEEEICEICLIKKEKSTNHCYVCNRCVKDFYFHSKFFNMCFHRKNIYYYILFYSSHMAIYFSFIYFMFYKVSNDYFKQNIPQNIFQDNTLSLYKSEYYITNFMTFLLNLDLFGLIFVIFCFSISVISFQNWLIMLCCRGYKVTYNNMFRMHKKAVGKLEFRQDKVCNIPVVNTVSICEFIKNLFIK